MSDRNVKIIAFVGMPGAGKSSAVDHLAAKGFPKIYFGGIMYQLMKSAGINPGDWGPEQKFREDLRKNEGEDVIAKHAIPQIRTLIESGQRKIIIDGLYSWTEYRTLKREFPGELVVVSIITPRKIRHRRLSQRPERPLTENEAMQRDWAEIENLEKGGPIAIADHFIINDGTLDQLYERIDEVTYEAHFCKAPEQC